MVYQGNMPELCVWLANALLCEAPHTLSFWGLPGADRHFGGLKEEKCQAQRAAGAAVGKLRRVCKAGSAVGYAKGPLCSPGWDNVLCQSEENVPHIS